MKKVFVILFAMVIAFSSKAQTLDSLKATATEAVQSVKDAANTVDTSSVSKQLYADVKNVIGSLATGLKVGSEHVYGILVKQQLVSAITDLILLLLGAFFVGHFMSKVASNEKWEKTSSYETGLTGLGALRVIQIIVGGLFLVYGLCCINSIITGFINPEYGAIEKIVDMIGDMYGDK